MAEGRLVNVNKFHVIVNDLYFEKSNILDALEFALKLYFALDLSYPSSSNTLWTFAQKVLLKIDIPGELNNRSVEILVGEIRQTLKNSDEPQHANGNGDL